MSVTRLNPDTLADASALGYSQISVCPPGHQVFISGQVAWTRDSHDAPDDLVEQTRIAATNLLAALEAAGSSAQLLTALRIYVVDLDAERMGQVGGMLVRMLEGAQPCMTMVGVTALVAPDLQVEIEATAVTG